MATKTNKVTLTTTAGKPTLVPQAAKYSLNTPVQTTNKVTQDIGINGMLNPNNLAQYSTPNSTSKVTKSTGGTGGGANTTSTLKTYLDQMINAYTQGAEANKATAKSTYDQTVADVNRAYDTTANNLLTSINRFREQNAQNVADQKKAYLANQAALESARSEADRQSRIEAAARGLGGSGLTQLAQLQNLISQSQDISEVANENQSAMDTLRKALAQSEEDYNTNLTNAQTTRDTALSNALSNYNNTIQGIDADLANKIANASWDFGTTSASMSRGSGGGSSSGGDEASSVIGSLQAIQGNFADDVQAVMGNSKKASKKQAKQLRSLYSNYSKQARQYQVNTKYTDAVNTNISNLKSILRSYGVSS